MNPLPTPEPPLDRLTRQLNFAATKNRDQVAVSRTDLEYLFAQLREQQSLAYKEQTPPA